MLRDLLFLCLSEQGGLSARPGDPEPRQLGQVNRVLAGRRVQTPDKAGSGGCRGNLASGPEKELGFGRKRATAACRAQQTSQGTGEPLGHLRLLVSLLQLQSRQLAAGLCGNSWVVAATLSLLPPPASRMPTMPWGGAVPWFPRNSLASRTRLHLPKLCRASLPHPHPTCGLVPTPSPLPLAWEREPWLNPVPWV